MLGTKEVNERTRNASYSLLVAIGTKAQESGGDFTEDAFLSMILAGLGGDSPHMISAAVLSLARVAYEFRSTLSQELLAQTLEAIVVLLAHPAREVVKSVLSYLKMVILVNKRDYVLPVAPAIVDAITTWRKDVKEHFRQKARVLTERLVRKCGWVRRGVRHCATARSPHPDHAIVH